MSDTMADALERVAVGAISPFFIVADVSRSIAFYRRLGFERRFAEPEEDPFFAIIGRGLAQILLKHVDSVPPQPNPERHGWVAWDGFVFVADPDGLAKEFEAEGLALHRSITDRADGLRGFEIRDPDGYVLFFGRPL